ncbi:hypothetical protein, partial [Thiolapillus sp.]
EQALTGSMNKIATLFHPKIYGGTMLLTLNSSLKRDKYKNDLREMEPHRVHLIWPALTSSQRKLALSMGHSAPP